MSRGGIPVLIGEDARTDQGDRSAIVGCVLAGWLLRLDPFEAYRESRPNEVAAGYGAKILPGGTVPRAGRGRDSGASVP